MEEHSASKTPQVPLKEDNNENGSNDSGINNVSNSNDFVIRDGFAALRLPNNGQPWIDGPEPIPRFSFWACEEALVFQNEQTLQQLQADCETVFTARTKEQDQPYSLGVTYFCPCQMKPRCALEALVLDIFQKYTEKLPKGTFVPEQSGAEWWTLVLDEDDGNGKKQTRDNGNDGDGNGDGEDEDDEDESDEVGMHFDADYGLEDQAPNLLLHPRWGTVTYFSDCGAPTLVLNQRSPPPDDVEKKTLQRDVDKGWLSHPKTGKHIAFDGRLLHGAPATFFPGRTVTDDKTGEGQDTKEPPSKKLKLEQKMAPNKRYTLLVNIWLNHCPLDAELLEEEFLEKLVTPWQVDNYGDDESNKTVGFNWNESFSPANKDSDPFEKATLVISESDPAGEEEVVICNHLVTIKYGATMKKLHEVTNKGSLVELEFGRGALSLDVGDMVQEEDHDGEEE